MSNRSESKIRLKELAKLFNSKSHAQEAKKELRIKAHPPRHDAQQFSM